MTVDMDDAGFQAFLNASLDELERKNEALRTKFGLGTQARWWFDQNIQKLQFFDDRDRLVIEADAIYIGSHSLKSNTWKWGWAAESLLPDLRLRAEPLRLLQDSTGFDLFVQSSAFTIDGDGMAWELTAMAVKQLDALGCYRIDSPTGALHIFLALMDIRRVVH